jgi:hypothetical protein
MDGQWVTIPRSQRGEPDYDEHIAMVQALAEGSSWCLRFDNAHGYLQGGNLHFFVDRMGKSQVAINETNGRITQIQKRYNQDSTVPVPYSQIIFDWAKRHSYSGHENEINTALNAKPQYDALKNELKILMAQKNYPEAFEKLGITCTQAPDGTYVLDKYVPKVNRQYSIFDLGVNEDELLRNVSKIESNLDLDGSSVTAMPNLKEINGRLTLGDNKIGDLRSLETLNGHKIYWDK